MQNGLLTSLVVQYGTELRGQRLVQKFTKLGLPISSSLFLVPAHLILPLFLRCQGFPCLHRLLGQDEDSHILFTAGLEAPLKQKHIHNSTTPARRYKSWIHVPVYDTRSFALALRQKRSIMVSHEILHSSRQVRIRDQVKYSKPRKYSRKVRLVPFFNIAFLAGNKKFDFNQN